MKELINYLTNKLNIKNKELLEKDILLHILLINLEENQNFKENYAFKGGTCLIKCYLGYYRFSEDLDFSYIPQEKLKNKSEKQIRKELTKNINEISNLLIKITKKFNFEFSNNKSDIKYYEFGANNKFVTFKLWYISKITNKQQFIKIQINFVEKFYYKFKTKQISNLIKKIDNKEFKFLFPKYHEVLFNYPKIKTYDIREILLEKYRAILTRKALKARDFIDLYLIQNTLNENTKKYKKQIIDKTKYMLNKYQKYRSNFNLRKKLGFKYIIGEESKLLIKEIDISKLEKFNNKQIVFIEEIITEI